jgi:3-hydroxyisobutyrate dehydrogenase/2-hydroxy-3-oxopropionate reductase
MAKLAWLGLGAMGIPMASRLIEAGHDLTVWNRSRAKSEAFEGRARIATTPADAARGVDATITMLATPDAVDEVVLGSEGAVAGPDGSGTLIDMSTVGQDYVGQLRSRLPEGVELVDAPVLGSVSNAKDGTLKLFIGGTEEAFERWSRVLEPIGKPMHMGPLGSGQAMKLVANSALAGLMSLTGETLALADALGLAQDDAIAGLLESPLGPAMKRKIDKIESGNYTPSFKLELMLKDMRLVDEHAAKRNVDLRLISDAREWIERAYGRGYGGYDYSAVVAAIRGREATG